MPSRLTSIAIIFFWLATMGWVFYREVAPWFGTGEPPVFHIGLNEEVSNQKVSWEVLDGKGKRVGTAHSYIKRKLDQPFELLNELRFNNMVIPTTIGNSKLTKVSDLYRVDVKGKLVEFNALMQLEINSIFAEITVSGKVINDQFVPKVLVSASGDSNPKGNGLNLKPFDLPAVDVSNKGKIISILYPQNKIVGLFEGRTWKVSVFNPMSASVSVFTRTLPIPSYKAEVFSAELEWREKKYACWRVDVTEPSENARRARIWVRKSDGLVLQHEANYQDHDLVLRRLK